MDTLVSLTALKQQLSEQIARADLSDTVLPTEFKNRFVSFGEHYRVEEYYQYTLKTVKSK